MSLYDQILELFPLISYEEERAFSGHVSFVREEECRSLAKGVTYHKRLYKRGNGDDVWVYLAEVAKDAGAELAVSACPLRIIKPVLAHAAEFDRKALFAMNAGYFHFFNNGDKTPYSIQVVHGVTLAEPGNDKPQYSNFFFGVTKEGEAIIADAEAYSKHWRGKLEYAVGGGLKLIDNGKIHLHNDATIAPRTFVAITEEGTVLLLNADGRSSISAGLTYADMIDICLGLGHPIRDMLNLDGGGSTTVVLREKDGSYAIHNVPSGPPAPGLPAVEPHGGEQARPVSDAILIVEK